MLLIGVEVIAGRYEVGHRTITSWIKDGAPFMRLGRKLAVDDDELEAWLRINRLAADKDKKTCQEPT